MAESSLELSGVDSRLRIGILGEAALPELSIASRPDSHRDERTEGGRQVCRTKSAAPIFGGHPAYAIAGTNTKNMKITMQRRPYMGPKGALQNIALSCTAAEKTPPHPTIGAPGRHVEPIRAYIRGSGGFRTARVR